MLLKKKRIERDGSGIVTLIPQDTEDLWHTFNLILKEDHIRASTVRRVVSQTSTGSTDKSAIRLSLTLTVTGVSFDGGGEGMVRVAGRNGTESKFIKVKRKGKERKGKEWNGMERKEEMKGGTLNLLNVLVLPKNCVKGMEGEGFSHLDPSTHLKSFHTV